MKGNLALNLAVALFRALLALYPSTFRRRFGPEMTQVFQDSARAALTSGGSRMMAILWITAVWDLIATAFVERMTEEYHMSVSYAGRVAGLLGAIGGAIWIVGSLAVAGGNEEGGSLEWVVAVAAAMMTIGVIGLYLRSGLSSTGALTIAFLFLGYLLLTIGSGMLALSGNGWGTASMGNILALVGAAAFGIYASRQRWQLPWTLIVAVIGVLSLLITLPLALGLVGDGGGNSTSLGAIVTFAYFGAVGINALIVSLLAMTGETQVAPPVLPAV